MGVEKLISDVKLSSVVPASITGDDKVHEFTNMDLVMKLHYIKGVYFFKNDAVEGLHIPDLKQPMFQLLELYYQTSGRIRRSGGGDNSCRPFIKCNDSGVRIVEAKCSNKTIDEWLAMNNACANEELSYDQVLGPDLGFAPLVYIQFTWFKCGGLSIGLSWAHVLGDAFSASNFLNIWGQIMAGQFPPNKFLNKPTRTNKFINIPLLLSTVGKLPFSLKKVDPVGDHWKITNTCKMQSHSIHITQKQLNQLISKVYGTKVKPFDVICATIWKILAKVRGEYSSEPMIVTIIRREDNSCDTETTDVSSNGQVISIVEANNVKVYEVDTSKLTKLIAEKVVDETRVVEELMEKENGDSDFVVYGENLTFVNLEEARIYDLELRGKKPIFASYNISGVGDEGGVFVLPGPEGGRIVNVVLPKDQIEGFKNELREELGVF
ncbi:hypothetical protein RND71_026942 [Anisodus tanguticus]|uniref:Uncharacterized protein n=1 Tax=Anisodus tanguticus TaxID=243964 RepID=A0AAE1RN46_9SOLA|nr:hypothetical protein RND71_026942 [Anisodus tanguticus]